MASLNLSSNGPSITKSYLSIVNAPPPTGPAAASPTYGQWAVFTVSAPLVSAFQQESANKESVLKVQSTGEGELVDLIDEFSDGRVQFAYVKVKDPNTGLPKNALVGWCGEGVPERTKGYFTSHLATVAKFLHGYHVQITARSDRDLTPDGIIQKVADSSGSKYTAGETPPPVAAATKPSIASKPVFTPTQSIGGSGAFNPLSRPRVAPSRDMAVDADGWGEDAPQVTRTQLEKVAPAYKPTRVDMRELTSQKPTASSFQSSREKESPRTDIIGGSYQPVGKVDIAALRRQAKDSGARQDERAETVRGAYEPVGKVDIAAIRAKAKPADSSFNAPTQPVAPAPIGRSSGPAEEPRSLADRSSVFSGPERLTSLPKPKVANKFGSSAFTGTKAPLPGGFEPKPPTTAVPVGSASRTFADEGGKTPAQIWAEKKARQRGASGSGDAVPVSTYTGQSPVIPQTSGGGGPISGYTGKSWAPVDTTYTGKSAGSSIGQQRTGEIQTQAEEEAPSSPLGGIGAIRKRFGDAPPIMGAPSTHFTRPGPEPEISSKPRGIPIPGLPTQSSGDTREAPSMPSPPPQPPRTPTPPTPEEVEPAPFRLAIPVKRVEVEDAHDEQISPPPVMPMKSVEEALPEPEDDEPDNSPDLPRQNAMSLAVTAAGSAAVDAAPSTTAASSGERARAEYEYEAAEDNEVSLREGEIVTNIDRVDPDWWLVTNEHGQTGLVPANYLTLITDDEDTGPAHAVPAPAAPEPASPVNTGGAAAGKGGATAIALYDYEAAEDNEISFPENAIITNVTFPDEDWWQGEYNGRMGLFPANYTKVQD